MPEEPIDAVYTWVDGSSSPFPENLAAFLRVAPDSRPDPTRFQDHGELRFSLRSLAAHAPWVRNVYVVTSGQVPTWLDTRNPRISIVDVSRIFIDQSHLPTFNSAAIEVHLHRIPNLSRRFLHFDDDLFLGRPVTPADFLTPTGGQYVYRSSLGSPRRPAVSPGSSAYAARSGQARRVQAATAHAGARPAPARSPRTRVSRGAAA